MEHAYAIEEKATKKAIVQHSRGLGDSGPVAESSITDFRSHSLHQQFADIPALFRPFADLPDPGSFDRFLASLDTALSGLSWGSDPKDPVGGRLYPANPILDKMGGSESYIETWTGKAAVEFKANVVDPFPSIERNQFLLAAVLRGTLEANRAIWLAARKNVDDIAHGTLEALDNMDECGRNQWPIGWTVAACLAGIYALPLSGLAAVAMSTVSAAAWVQAANPPESAPTTDFSGESAEVVISHLREQITKLTGDINDQEHKIAQALTETNQVVYNHRSRFVAMRPALADATPSNIMGPDQMGYSL
jgi:hypothetical protein